MVALVLSPSWPTAIFVVVLLGWLDLRYMLLDAIDRFTPEEEPGIVRHLRREASAEASAEAELRKRS